MTRELEIGNINIEVVKKDIKNLHLAVYPPNGRVRLAAPEGVDDETLRLFTISKLAWIRKQQRRFASQERLPERKYVYRESHYFLGKRYLLRLIETDKRPQVELKNKTFIDLHIKSGSSKEQCQQLLTQWYRAELKRLIPEILTRWELKIGVQVEDWGIKQMKTKWGTCNVQKKRILLNLELAKKPVHCLEYIIVHELVHLLERLHNERFLAYMDKFMPRWKFYREELNKLPVSHVDWEY
jgi:predicted metal-dependent hydrolase